MNSSKPARGAEKRVGRDALARYLEQWLEPSRFKDYCPNGLQVEGKASIVRLVCGVTASQALLEAAVAARADALLVHHGYFWRGEEPCLVGIRRTRIATLLKHDLNLFAYHLPLDVHPEFGNNAQLARVLGWPVSERVGDYGLVNIAELDEPTTVSSIVKKIATRLGRKPLVVGDEARARERTVRCVAWCTGGAQDHIEEAAAAGAELFVSGEISERTTHLARELGVVYVAAGHHATERFGVQALGARIAGQFGIDVQFIDDPNPV